MVEFIEEALVLSTTNDTAVVKITPRSPCSKSHKGCLGRGCVIGSMGGSGEFIAEADNTIKAKQGQKVIIKIESPDYYKALLIVFVMPIVCMMLGYLIGIYFRYILHNAEYYFAVSGFALSFLVMQRLSRKIKSKYKITSLV